jgi:voltage-gated potassium channel
MFEAESVAQPDKFATLGDSAYFTMVTIATVGYGDISPITPFGRCLAIFTFMSALIIFAGVLGIVGNTMYKVLEEEYDPNIDPIEEFRKEKERMLLEKCSKQ